MTAKRKVAIAYDWIDKWGGVERVLITLNEIFPEALFYTSVYDEKNAAWAKNMSVKTSFMQKFPDFIKKSRLASVPFYMLAFENQDFRDFDLVISVTSSFAKSIVTMPETKHVCYLLTPTRFLWSHQDDYFHENYLNRPLVNHIKKWDVAVSKRPDKIISISDSVRKRCLKYYGVDSEVIYPPFDVGYWSKIKSDAAKTPKAFGDKYYLIVSRLEPYKKIDLAVKTFSDIGKRLVVVGRGTGEKYLKSIAGPNISFLKDIPDRQLAVLYKGAEALVMPQEEDFGYVSLESQFFGTPVITHKTGGGSETVADRKTGLFFDNSSEASFRRTIERFEVIGYNLRANLGKNMKEYFSKFEKSNFIREFKESL
ncbi:MAG: glycosyltransferase [Patescibacteria group bacterium]